MRYKDISAKETTELTEMLKNSKIKLGELRFELVNKSLKDTSQINKVKKEISIIKTAINSKNRL